MVIDSFSIAYLAVEDRLLLQLRSKNGNQNFWITRRGAAILYQAIQSLLTQMYERSGVKAEYLPLAQNFGQNHAISQNAPFIDTLHKPDSSPLLLFQVKYGATDANQGKLILLNNLGTGQSLHLTTETLHTISNLLAQQCSAAEWALLLKPVPNTMPTKDSSTILH